MKKVQLLESATPDAKVKAGDAFIRNDGKLVVVVIRDDSFVPRNHLKYKVLTAYSDPSATSVAQFGDSFLTSLKGFKPYKGRILITF